MELFLSLDELDVVEEQHVDGAVVLLELGHSTAAQAHGIDELVEELFGRHVAHPIGRVVDGHVVGDGLQEVRLAETGVAVDEQRVVRPRRCLGDAERCGVSEAVGGTRDECLEGVPAVHRLARQSRGSAVTDVARRKALRPPRAFRLGSGCQQFVIGRGGDDAVDIGAVERGVISVRGVDLHVEA